MGGENMQGIFLEEMGELLQDVERDLLALADSPTDGALVDRLFRNLHTIKGGAGMVEMDDLSHYTHGVENMLDEVRKGRIATSPAIIALLLEALDCLKNFLEEALGSGPLDQERLAASRQRIQAAMQGNRVAPAPLPPPTPPPPQEEPPAAMAREETYILQVRARIENFPSSEELAGKEEGLRQLGTLLVISHEHSLPPMDKQRADEFYLWRSMHLVTIANLEQVMATLAPWPLHHQVEIIHVNNVPEAPAHQQQVDAAVDGYAPVLETLPAFSPPPLPLIKRSTTGRTDAPSLVKLGSIRVDTGKLDKLVNLVGEMITVAARLDSFQTFMEERDTDLAEGLLEILDDSSRIVRELQDQAITIRMVPIGNAFDPMKRLVHDYCATSGKQIRLSILGQETEVDKKVAEQLSGPLKHLIRNSLDHGLETPAEREAKGKPPEGEITLSACHQYGLIVIQVLDNGRGIDVKRVIQSAKEKGIIDGSRELSEREGLELIFAPSVSTAREVTEISGRGVGMDVVRRDIEALRGNIEIASTMDQGTTITIRIPLTLSIVEGLLVCVGDNRYIIPLSMVEECVELTDDSAMDEEGSNFLDIRGDLVPFLRLRDLFKVPGEVPAFEKIVIVTSGNRHVGLVVDHLLGNHQTVIKSLSPLHRNVECFMGATILGDGRVVLILDVLHLIEFGQNREERRRIQERREAP
ncbi:MAG: chemotaxis protein CheA [Magnetococcales bacterium]|nr:chemotaxis protein CheA [Magnetococcales bacterium]